MWVGTGKEPAVAPTDEISADKAEMGADWNSVKAKSAISALEAEHAGAVDGEMMSSCGRPLKCNSV
jgi:hypothetical protein